MGSLDRPSDLTPAEAANAWVGRCRLTPGWPRLVCAWLPRLKLKSVEALSNFAFNLNLRRYTWAEEEAEAKARGVNTTGWDKVGRCRLCR
jgi:hypothetical protein